MKTYCIIVPSYNEEKRLKTKDFLKFVQENEHISFLFVNDGSKDKTIDLLQSLETQSKRIKALDLKVNKGKAEAVRSGILNANSMFNQNFDYLGYYDADLATPLYEINNFIKMLDQGAFEMILGCRNCRLGAQINRKLSRHYISRVFATIVSLMLNLKVYDTQCGAKLMKATMANIIFADSFTDKFLFDVELLFRIQSHPKLSSNTLYEYPLSKWDDVGGSKLKMRDFIFAPLGLYKIYKRYK